MAEDLLLARTRRFYDWEIRGRGWQTYSYPVELEPPFRPFLGHDPPRSVGIDEGKRETFFSGLLESSQAEELPAAEEYEEPLPDEYRGGGLLREVRVRVEPGGRTDGVTEAWLSLLGNLDHPFAVELVGGAGEVEYRLAFNALDLLVEDALAGLAPALRVESTPPLAHLWKDGPSAIFEFALAREFMESVQASLADAHTPLLVALAQAGRGECAVVQVLSAPVRKPWAESIRRSVLTPNGQPFFADNPDLTRHALEKISSPLRAVVVRLVVSAGSEERVARLLQGCGAALDGFGSATANGFFPLPASGEWSAEADLLDRTTHRSGMILSLAELEPLVRVPDGRALVPGLLVEETRTKAAPAAVRGEGVLLGRVEHQGEEIEARLPVEARLRHMHVIGASGTGKSTLLLSMIERDLVAGHGLALLDPHGDLVEAVTTRIPSYRLADTVLLDPGDTETAVGMNLLSAGTQSEAELVASDLVATFRRLATSWGDQMTAVLSNALLSVMASGGGTLLDLRSFLLSKETRRRVLSRVRDPYLASFWENEFPILSSGKSIGPILTRLDTFLRFRMVRRIVSADKTLDFEHLEDGGIFLANLSAGRIGQENAALLGALLVSKLFQAATRRKTRTPFFLYLDEFHEVATPSMASVVTGARKFGVGLVMAHQNLYQLRSAVPEVERAVLGNAHARIVFRVGEEDARKLAPGFSFFEADDLGALGIGEAIARVGGRESDFKLSTDLPHAVGREVAEERRDALRDRMRERFPVEEAETKEAAPPAGEEVQPVPVEASKVKPKEEREATPSPPLKKDLLDYLEAVAEHPFQGVRERNSFLSVSASKGARLKEELVAAGLIREVSVSPGGRGRAFKLSELTREGQALLDELGVKGAPGLGRGGVAHRWWVREIKDFLSGQGITATVEDDSRGARADLTFELGDESVAVEVETSVGHEEENIRRDLEAGYQSVIVLTDSKRRQAALVASFKDNPAVSVGALQDYREILDSLLRSDSSSLRPPNQNEERKPERREKRPAPSPSERPVTSSSPFYPPGVLSTPEAASYVGLSPATLETKRSRGGGPPFSKLGARVVYRREDLDAWLEARLRQSTSDVD